MALSVRRIGEHITHALGGDSQFEPVEVVNLAGEDWVNIHTWQYLRRRSKSIDLVADQEYVDLGDEVRDIISMYPTNSLTNHVQWTTTEEINRLRTTVHGTYSGYWAAQGFRKDATTGDLHQIAELWPTPSASSTAYFTLFHTSGWVRVTSDDDKVDLPDWLEPRFIQWCRAYAEGLEDSDQGSVEQRQEGLLASQSFQRAMGRDGALQLTLGKPEGGVAHPDRQDLGRIYVVDSVASPS